MNTSTMIKSATAVAAGAILAVAVPLAASAHVTITPDAAEAGSYSVVTFKVPNESATAGTNKIEISLPTDTPFTSVRYVPVAGWTAELVRETLPEPVTVGDSDITEAVTSIIWTADAGSEITDGQMQQFSLSLGAVPDTGSIELPTDQFYTDGSVVSWNEEGEDASYPAPVLYINDEAVADHHGGSGDAGHSEDTTATEGASSTTDTPSDDVVARGLGLGGLVLGAIGLVLGVTARRKNAA